MVNTITSTLEEPSIPTPNQSNIRQNFAQEDTLWLFFMTGLWRTAIITLFSYQAIITVVFKRLPKAFTQTWSRLFSEITLWGWLKMELIMRTSHPINTIQSATWLLQLEWCTCMLISQTLKKRSSLSKSTISKKFKDVESLKKKGGKWWSPIQIGNSLIWTKMGGRTWWSC